jgi:hypothetical protein
MSLEPAAGLPLRRILLMGSSEITFDDHGTGLCLAELMESALANLRPEYHWEIHPHVAYQMANLPERCLRLAERVEPDLIALWMGGNNFSEETVSFAVYHRSRRLYPYFDRIVNAGRVAAGDGPEASMPLRGALYRALRAIGRGLIGRRTFIDPEVALAATLRTIELLQPRWPVICRLPYRDSCRQPDQEGPSRRRVELYNAAVREACRRLSIPCISPSDEIEAGGVEYRMAADRLHADFPSRRLNAAIAAGHVVQTLERSDAAAAGRPRVDGK